MKSSLNAGTGYTNAWPDKNEATLIYLHNDGAETADSKLSN